MKGAQSTASLILGTWQKAGRVTTAITICGVVFTYKTKLSMVSVCSLMLSTFQGLCSSLTLATSLITFQEHLVLWGTFCRCPLSLFLPWFSPQGFLTVLPILPCCYHRSHLPHAVTRANMTWYVCLSSVLSQWKFMRAKSMPSMPCPFSIYDGCQVKFQWVVVEYWRLF